MSGTEETFHYTKEDVRKLESREARKKYDGQVPSTAESSVIKVPFNVSIYTLTYRRADSCHSIVDSHTKNKDELIDERKANLPLPVNAPVPSDWNSADVRTVNVGSGKLEDDISHARGGEAGLREPATAESDVRLDGEEWMANTAGSDVGRQAVDKLPGIPNDAVTRDARHKPGTVPTTHKEFSPKHDQSNASS